MIAGAGTVPLAELVEAYPPLNHVIWVVQRASRHLDWNEVPEGFGGKVGVAVWHDLMEERRPKASTELPSAQDGSEPPGVVTIWQKKEDDAGEVNEFTQGVGTELILRTVKDHGLTAWTERRCRHRSTHLFAPLTRTIQPFRSSPTRGNT